MGKNNSKHQKAAAAAAAAAAANGAPDAINGPATTPKVKPKKANKKLSPDDEKELETCTYCKSRD